VRYTYVYNNLNKRNNKYVNGKIAARVACDSTYRRIVLLPELRNVIGHVIVRDRNFFRDQFNVEKFHGVPPQFLQFLHRLPAGVHHVRVEWAKAGHQDRAFRIGAHFANAIRILHDDAPTSARQQRSI